MPKCKGHGQALVLSQQEADSILDACTPALRAVFSFTRCTAARISEVLSLRFENLTNAYVVLPKRICKGKTKTREVPINHRLAQEIAVWKTHWESMYKRAPQGGDYIFPGRDGNTTETHLTRAAADKALRKVCANLRIDGASTHSWRRSALSNADEAGISLRALQSISGHTNLDVLSRYLRTSDRQKQEACDAFG